MHELHSDKMIVYHQNTPLGHCLHYPVTISIILASTLRKPG